MSTDIDTAQKAAPVPLAHAGMHSVASGGAQPASRSDR